MPSQRITRDIDFLQLSQDETLENLKKIFLEIISIDLPDGVNFIKETLTTEEIILENIPTGKRISFTAELAKAILPMQIDIGYGDIIYPEPATLKFPVLLDFPIPEVKVYSIESVISEKFHAIARRGFLNIRMKDFYDILHFARNQKFDIAILKESIKKTFKKRNTPMNKSSIIFDKTFKEDINMQKKWQAFIRRNKLSATKNFSEVLKNLELFLKPICMIEKQETKQLLWDKEKWEWC